MIRSIALAGAALLFLATMPVSAAGNADPATPTQQGAGFVDKDGDGICDNYATHGGKGGMGKGHGAGFVDANNDGICDNAKAGKGMGQGAGQGKGQGQGKGKKGCCGAAK